MITKSNLIPAFVILVTLQYHPSALEYFAPNINNDVHPCENMQENTCGHFGEHFQPNSKEVDRRSPNSREYKYRNYNDVIFERRSFISTHLERHEQDDELLLAMLRGNGNVKAIRRAQQFFNKCLKNDEINTNNQADETMKEELKRVGFDASQSVYDMVNSEYFETLDHVEILANLLKYPTLFSNFFMFRVNVIEDLHEKGSYVPLILTTPEYPSALQLEEVNAQPYLMNYLEPRSYGLPLDKDKDRNLRHTFGAVDALWSHLAKLTKESTIVPLPSETYVRLTLEELQKQTDDWMKLMPYAVPYERGRYYKLYYHDKFKMDWVKFFTKLFDDVSNEDNVVKRIDSNFVVYVSDMTKIESLAKLWTTLTMKVYNISLLLATTTFVIPIGPQRLQEDYFSFATTTPKIVKENRQRACLAIIKDTFRSVVANELLQHVSEDDGNAIHHAVDITKETFDRVFKEVEWLSKEAKDSISSKIQSLRVWIPDIKTLKNGEHLEDIYAEIDDMENMSFYKAYMQITSYNRKKEFRKIFGTNAVEPSWLELAPPVDILYQDVVKYYPLTNDIVVSITAFKRPYYYGSENEFLPFNLGGFGFRLVRQMAHALDNLHGYVGVSASQSQWTDEDKSMFINKIKSVTTMVKRTERNNEEDDPVGWKMAQLEAIADDISLNVCLRALADNNEISGTTPVTLKMSKRYLMSSLATTMCRRPPSRKSTYVDYADRINELFKRSKQFEHIWDCSEEDAMMQLKNDESRKSILDGDNNFNGGGNYNETEFDGE